MSKKTLKLAYSAYMTCYARSCVYKLACLHTSHSDTPTGFTCPTWDGGKINKPVYYISLPVTTNTQLTSSSPTHKKTLVKWMSFSTDLPSKSSPNSRFDHTIMPESSYQGTHSIFSSLVQHVHSDLIKTIPKRPRAKRAIKTTCYFSTRYDHNRISHCLIGKWPQAS